MFLSQPGSHYRGMGVNILFGIEEKDTGSRWDKDDHGEIIFDSTFDVDDPAAQTWLLETAQQARRLPYRFAPLQLRFYFLQILKCARRQCRGIR